MRDPFPWPEDGTAESLVRQHRDAEARTEGAERGDAVLARVFAQLDADAPRPTLSFPVRPGRWRAALAAGLVAAGLVVGLLFIAQPSALAAQLVSEAHRASLREVDRGYLFQVHTLGDDGNPAGAPLRESRLWTRGDRYRIESSDPNGVRLGQDEEQRLWIAPTREAGSRFAADEISEKLDQVNDMRMLKLDVLLDMLTRRFHLDYNDALPASFPGTRRIVATPRDDRAPFGIQSVLLEVEPTSKVVRRIVLERVRTTTQTRVRLTLQLSATETKPDSFYHLESALNPGAPIHEKGDPAREPLLGLFLRRIGSPAQ